MKYNIKILEVLSTIREIEAPNADAAIAKAENMYVKGEAVLELETNSITVVNDKEEV
jgi:hypothetical protein